MIYIPLCFYFIQEDSYSQKHLNGIYIPLCFYFIACTIRIVLSLTLFTFHYASTLSYQVVNYGKMEFIYIPLCFYFIHAT